MTAPTPVEATPDSAILDVAIIGAGVAGAYCAYRLSRDTDLHVALFEAGDRVGGRLWSHHWPAADALVELGGEAFSPIHANVFGLVQRELGLPVQPHAPFNTLHRLFLRDRLAVRCDMLDRAAFPAPATPAGEARLRYFLDDAYFNAGGDEPAPSPPTAPPTLAGPAPLGDVFEQVARHILARLSPEVGEAYGALMGAYGARLAALSPDGEPLTADQAAAVITPDLYALIAGLIHAVEHADIAVSPLVARTLGKDRIPARDLDFWSLVTADMGQEVYDFFLGAGYDNTSALQFNLVELVQNLLIGGMMGLPRPGFWTVTGGLDLLPKTLVAQSGAALHLGRRLTRLDRDAAAGFTTLTFAHPDGGASTCRARRVIFTAPLSFLDRPEDAGGIALAGFDAGALARFATDRGGIARIPAGKLFLVYPRPWWSEMAKLPADADRLHGYANTDLPARAIYYKGHAGDGERGLITGALADGISNDFWSGFLAPGCAIFPGTDAADRRRFGAPVHMVDACHRMLARMHEAALPAPLPEPVAALYHEWREAGGGWSAWRSGRDIHALATRLRRPLASDGDPDDGGLACCGDSVAERHGWVEETIQSAELMLREAFALAPAPWLPGPDAA